MSIAGFELCRVACSRGLLAMVSGFRQRLHGGTRTIGQRERARAEVDMDSKQIVMALYGAYATGDADRIAGLLHDEVVWTAPAGNATQVALGLGRPEDAGPPRGQ